MEMCYDGALVMPSKFVVIDQEEMSYIDGGDAKMLSKNLLGIWDKSTPVRFALKQIGYTRTILASAASYALTAAVAKFGLGVLKVGAVVGGAVGAALVVGAAVGVAYLWNNRVFY